MPTLKTIVIVLISAGLLFLIWKFLRWFIVVIVIAGLVLAAYYVKFHQPPPVLTGGLLH